MSTQQDTADEPKHGPTGSSKAAAVLVEHGDTVHAFYSEDGEKFVQVAVTSAELTDRLLLEALTGVDA